MPQGTSSSASRQRRDDATFKTRVLAECARGDRSIAAVARAHGLSAQQIYQWRHDAAAAKLSAGGAFRRIELGHGAALPQACTSEAIGVELMRGGERIHLHWPAAHADALIAWLDQR